MFKICSLPKRTIKSSTLEAYADLAEILAKHKDVLQQLSNTNNPARIKSIFLKNFNIQLSSIPKNIESMLYLLLYHSLKSLLNCSDVVLYQAEFDSIFGGTEDYLWLRAIVSDPNNSSRYETNIINLRENNETSNQISRFETDYISLYQNNKKVELLNVYLIEGKEDFAFERISTDILLEDGILFAKLPDVKDKDGNVLKTKRVELSGTTGNISIRSPKTTQKARKFEEFNLKNSPNSVATDSKGKTTAIYYNGSDSDVSAAKRMLHSVKIQSLICLLETTGHELLIPKLLSSLFNEGIMLEVHREQEFNGIAGLSVIALAHNVNYYIELIIEALRKGEDFDVKEGIIYLDGKPIERLNHNKPLLQAKINAAISLINDMKTIIEQKKLDMIREQAKSFEANKSRIIQKEKNRLKILPLHELAVCFFEPISVNTILPLIPKDKIKYFLAFLKTNNMLLQSENELFLNIKTLSQRSLLLNGFFRGYPPKDIQALLQPNLRGKVICKPTISKSGQIQTRVILLFDKPIHKNIEELLMPIFIQDELSSEKIFLDPRLHLEDFSPDKVPYFEKSKDGTTLELIIDYDIWSYPDRKIFFRFCEGIANVIQYEDNLKIKSATDIPNILLTGGKISTVRNSETDIMEFFETIMKTRKYESQRNKEPESTSILGRCILYKNYKRSVLSYFIKNHIDDLTAIKLEPMLLRIMFRYLILNIDDANFAIQQIKTYRSIKKLEDDDNPFLRAIKLDIKRLNAILPNS